MLRSCPTVLPVLVLFLASLAQAGPTVRQSKRDVPVAHEVDVVVVGGSTGAVAAAVEAAATGAKVFLAAPYPYLGEDMTATLRLWLEPGETPDTPLAKQIFLPPDPSASIDQGNRLTFSYRASKPEAAAHRDTNPPSRLNDGQFGDASRQSVQYESDVEVVADLGEAQDVAGVRVMAYHRDAADPKSAFKVQQVSVLASNDGQQWQALTTIKNEAEDASIPLGILSAVVKTRSRYLKFAIQKSPTADRMLLGEIQVFGPSSGPPPAASFPSPRPLHVKKTLDEALLKAGVQYLYSCYATDVVRDPAGRLCGVVIGNRAGRQVVLARTIIDATDRAVVARKAGAAVRPFVPGKHVLKRVVIGGEVQQAEGLSARVVAPPFHGPFPNPANTPSGEFQVIEYTAALDLADDSYAAWEAAEQHFRSLTYHPQQQFTSDAMFAVLGDSIQSGQSASGPWGGADKVPLGALRPAKTAGLYVLGACADVSRQQAEMLLRPLALIRLGQRVGRAAAEEARATPAPKDARVPASIASGDPQPGEVREVLDGIRPALPSARIAQDTTSLPVLGSYDVLVVGGGTTGAPAGIGAARQGAKTLVCEYLHGLGGVGTAGAISTYYWGNRVGFTATIPGERKWVIEEKMEWYRQELLKAKAEIWFGVIGCGALVRDGRVVGAIVATPQGRGAVLAKVVIDATGNADIAAAAGAGCIYTDETEFGMQGTGLPARNLGATYANTDFTITDETDMVDIWHTFVYAKDKYPKAFDQGRLIDTRERRRIVGDFVMSLIDQVNLRTYPDTIVVAYSNFDSHGYTIDPYLLLEHPHKKGFYVNVPYRCVLPKGLEGILVGGLATSMHRDAVPLTRMQADLQNQGYALGVAAAMTSRAGALLRQLDIRALQQHLVKIGNLPESVLGDVDSYPLPAEKIAEAVASLPDEFKGAAVVMAHPEAALPLLRKAYASAEGDARLAYAKALAVLGDATGLDLLVARLNQADAWDSGWNYRGMGQFGGALSEMDNLIVALGRTRDRRAVAPILAKLRMLTPESDFSHYRAVALALEMIGDKAAAQPMAALLATAGIGGRVNDSIDVVRQREAGESTVGVAVRRDSLRELILARALYRCGDHEKLGEKTLQAYTRDFRGHLARHAKAVLDAGRRP